MVAGLHLKIGIILKFILELISDALVFLMNQYDDFLKTRLFGLLIEWSAAR
jgi:hypothetical protein